MPLTSEEKAVLLNAARQSIAAVFGESGEPSADFGKFPSFSIRSGAFVTLTIKKDLRGCIGYIFAEITCLKLYVKPLSRLLSAIPVFSLSHNLSLISFKSKYQFCQKRQE